MGCLSEGIPRLNRKKSARQRHNTLTGKLDKSILNHIQKAEIQHNQYALPFALQKA